MKDATELPLALYHANAALQARIGGLIQEGSQHWLELGQRLLNDGLVESGTEIQALMRSQDWQAMSALPAEAFWRQLQQRFGDQQAAAQIMVAAHTAFARGLQDAVQAWQHETVVALEDAGLAFPVADPDWSRLFSGWEALLAGNAPTAARASRPAAKPAPAAPVKQAAKKAPRVAKKAAAAPRAKAKKARAPGAAKATRKR